MIESFAKKIHWLGHDGFRIDSEKIIYFDPYQIEAGPQADLILISHDHFDHCSPEDVAKIQGPETIIVTEKDSSEKLTGDVRILKPGEALNLDGVKILGVPSYNTDKDFHPRKNGPATIRGQVRNLNGRASSSKRTTSVRDSCYRPSPNCRRVNRPCPACQTEP